MTPIRKRYRIPLLLGLCTVALLAVALTACGDKEDDDGRNRVVWDPSKPISGDRAGSVALVVTGRAGTAWRAEIAEGAAWLSFDASAPGSRTERSGVVGTALSDRIQYLYYWPNDGDAERRAVVRFTFQGEAERELVLTQPAQGGSGGGSGDLYERGLDDVWPEIPARADGVTAYRRPENLVYVYHTAQMNGREARNYAMCFDRTKRGAWWVAYPLTPTGYTGSLSRPSSWYFDPSIAQGDQANLEKYSYPDKDFDRGHQIPNADRNGIAEMQRQTFYCSNSTPQNASLNQGQSAWAGLEGRIRDWACSDTLYVVTGAVWSDARTTPDRDGKACAVPSHYFKVLLRTVAGNTRRMGDRMGDYGANELKSIGFWVSNASGQGNYASWAVSVEEIENKTGFEFFPTVPAAVKQQDDPRSWGL